MEALTLGVYGIKTWHLGSGVSSQGTGSISAYGFELQLLQCWGDWARGDIGLWYVAPGIWRKSGIGISFSEDDLCKADAVIASLPSFHKSTLKRWFISRKGHNIDERKKQAAIAAFSESLSGDEEESREAPSSH